MARLQPTEEGRDGLAAAINRGGGEMARLQPTEEGRDSLAAATSRGGKR